MARTIPFCASSRSSSSASTSSSAAAPVSSAASSPTSHRIFKRTTRVTRQSSRLANATVSGNSNSNGSGGRSLERMVAEGQVVAGSSSENGGSEDVMEVEGECAAQKSERECEEAAAFYDSVCPITDKNEKPFRLMDLPTEIRLEIYRACLTRPYTILLSKQSQAKSDDVSQPLPPRLRAGVFAFPTAAPTAPPATASFGVGASMSGGEEGPSRNQLKDPLLVNILRANKEIYKEARGVLYSENYFTLDLSTAQSTLACLHQRSRRIIKHVDLEIPSYNDILESFQETLRLSLRYCSGLKECIIRMPFSLPGADGSGTNGNTTVYANGFDILRWLPQQCNVIMKGCSCIEIDQVVNKHRELSKKLDKVRTLFSPLHGGLR